MVQITVYECEAGTMWDVVVTGRRGIPDRTTSRPDDRQDVEAAMTEAVMHARKMVGYARRGEK